MFLTLQVCDTKEDTYYCLTHAIEYLQDLKVSQRKQCKLYYTHSKEEISSVIKHLNKRLMELEDSSSEDEDDIEVKRIIEKKKPYKRPEPEPVESPGPSFSPTPSTSSSYPSAPRGRPATKKAAPKVEEDEDEDAKPLKKPKKEPVKPKKPEPKKTPASGKKPGPKKRPKEESEEEEDYVPVKAKKPKKEKVTKKAKEVEIKDEVKQRNVKSRRSAQKKTGNWQVEYLNMVLSATDDEDEDDSSDEGWK